VLRPVAARPAPTSRAGDRGRSSSPTSASPESGGRGAASPAQASNRITFHETERDRYGLHVPILNYQFHENSTAMSKHAANASKQLLESVGGRKVTSDYGGGGCHNMGVARMSADPRDGVSNRWGQAHDVKNLFVSDGSAFSSSAAANPTLTIVALAIRQADHIAASMSRKEL
jgi:choline dehydrogenase-like flavoprotein